MRLFLASLLCSIFVYADISVKDILRLKKFGYGESEILKSIREQGGIKITPNEYFQLKKAGFSETFLDTLANLNTRPQFASLPRYFQKFARKPLSPEVKKIWALVVGVNYYRQSKALPKLKFAMADAQGFIKHLLSLGVPAEQICFLYANQVTKKSLEQAVSKITKVDGELYFFYSGHGLYSSTRGFFFACADTDVKSLEDSAYSMRALKERLETMKASRGVLFLDACHSGSAKDADIEFGDEDEEKITLGKLNQNAYSDVSNLEKNAKPLMIISSCEANQISREGKGNGIFTSSLLAALQGKADRNKDNKVSLKEVLDFVNSDVARKSDFEQRPAYSRSDSWVWDEDKGLPLPQSADPIVKLKITPERISCKANQKTQFSVIGICKSGKKQKVVVKWLAKYGKINQSGFYTPVGKSKDIVLVKLEKLRARAYVTIGVQNDSYEPNDTIKQAKELAYGMYRNLQLIARESDWYKVKINKGENLRISLVFSHKHGDLDMYVYDIGSRIAKSTSSNDDEQVYLRDLAKGTYFIKVKGHKNTQTNYRLKIIISGKSIKKETVENKDYSKISPVEAMEFFSQDLKELKSQGYLSFLRIEDWDILDLAQASYGRSEYSSTRELLWQLKMPRGKAKVYLQRLLEHVYIKELRELERKGSIYWNIALKVAREAQRKFPEQEFFKQMAKRAAQENLPERVRREWEEAVKFQAQGRVEEALLKYQQGLYENLNSFYQAKALNRIEECKKKVYRNYYTQIKSSYRKGEWQKCFGLLKKLKRYQPLTSYLKVIERNVQKKLQSADIAILMPKGWDRRVWKYCWNKRGGYLDFTNSSWRNLSHNKQVEHAKSYQKWYADYKKLSLYKRFSSHGADFQMVLIPPGKFLMGSLSGEKDRENDEKQHDVLINKAFYLSKTEVTQQQWYRMTGEKSWSGKSYAKSNPHHAVNYVSWNDIKKKFLPKLSGKYSLPTEAQWEYACRAGTLARFYWGDDSNYSEIKNHAWYRENAYAIGEKYAHPVGEKRPNGWGLCDMSGNVYEWCEDYCEYKSGVVTNTYVKGSVNPICKQGSLRLIRGGDWLDSRDCRSASRGGSSPGGMLSYVGFRFSSPVP